MQRSVGVGCLARSGIIDQGRFLLGRFLLDHRPEAFTFGPPLLSVPLEQRLGLGLVQTQVARHPAVLGAQMTERIQKSRLRGPGEPRHRARAQKVIAQHRELPGRERHIRQKRVEVHGRLGRAHRVTVRRDRAVQVRQRLLVIEQAHFRKNAPKDVGDLGHALLEESELALERALFVLARALVAHVFVEEGGRALGPVGRKLPGEGEVVARLVVRSGLLERSPTLEIDDRGRRMRPRRARVGARRKTLRLDEEAPAGSQAPKRVIEPRARGSQLRIERACEIGPAKGERSLKDGVLLKDDAGCNQTRPRKPVGQAALGLSVFTKRHHGFPRAAVTGPGAFGF